MSDNASACLMFILMTYIIYSMLLHFVADFSLQALFHGSAAFLLSRTNQPGSHHDLHYCLCWPSCCPTLSLQFDYGFAFNPSVPQSVVDSFSLAILDAQVKRV